MEIDIVYYNGRITTLNPRQPQVSALGVTSGRIVAAGTDDDVLSQTAADTQRIDLNGRRVIPGLNDSHLHVIRAGLFYNMELRWDGVPTLAQAMDQLKQQAERTPPPQWVRVIGGWNEFQFAEGRLPSLDEINRAAPDTPVFILHLYDCALLNRAALRVLGRAQRMVQRVEVSGIVHAGLTDFINELQLVHSELNGQLMASFFEAFEEPAEARLALA